MVGPPKVINKRVDDQLLEPFEVTFVRNMCYVGGCEDRLTSCFSECRHISGAKVNPLSCVVLQIATVEVPEVYMGAVVELLGKRRGQMCDMQGLGSVHRPLHLPRNYTFNSSKS